MSHATKEAKCTLHLPPPPSPPHTHHHTHPPGPVRPALPALWRAEAWLMGVTTSESIPFLGLYTCGKGGFKQLCCGMGQGMG
jgi:hypothetical protein